MTIQGRTIDPVHWELANHGWDMSVALVNTQNPQPRSTIEGFFNVRGLDDSKNWKIAFSKDGMRLSADLVAKDFDKRNEEEAIGSSVVLTKAAERKKEVMLKAREKRMPTSSMTTSLQKRTRILSKTVASECILTGGTGQAPIVEAEE